jgi:putative ABC transport system substrate-binding protein
MKRREFMTLLGGAAAWPVTAPALQDERIRRIGVLTPGDDSPVQRARIEAFVKALEPLGWFVGRNLQIEARWAFGDVDLLRRYAAELVATAPDAILASTNQPLTPLRQATRTVPIVFVLGIDPIASGDVTSLARPGSNATGFLLYEYSISGKWLELLKEIAPGVTRVAVLRDAATAAGIGQFAAIQAVAPPFKVELSPVDVRDAGEIERALAALAREANGGLIVPASVAAGLHRRLIATLSARHRLPAIYVFSEFVVEGGLISYGPDLVDQYRAGAGYVARILKGEKAADLPVQAPTRYQLTVNLKTAKALGLAVPPALPRPRRRGDRMKRREFIGLVAGATSAWPLDASAQQPAMPVLGVLDPGSSEKNEQYLAPFRRGLAEAGYVEGQNVSVEYRWADGRYERLPGLAGDLVRRKVNVIAVPSGTPAALAAKGATSTIPIVFGVGDDPVGLGLVKSLARPGGNATGFNFFIGELVAKRLGVLRELVPGAKRVAVLVNPADAKRTEGVIRDVETAARDVGLRISVFNARTIGEIDAVFAELVRDRIDGLFVSPDSFFNRRRVQLALLAARHAVPATYGVRDYVEAGGLMSYGTSLAESRYQVGLYAGRILRGAEPADLPVLQPTKFELAINLTAARTIGLEIPPTLLARADEVIE